MNATLNTFPPFQSMNSPHGWALALIVLVHFGFFLALSSGMGGRIVDAFRPPPLVVISPPDHELPPPEPTLTAERVKIEPNQRVSILEPVLPEPVDETITGETEIPPPPAIDERGDVPRTPIITAPDFDPRLGLSEPVYPAAEIRAGHTGTVLLSIYVLENGRVGEIRLDQSSGYQRLDESAMREARRWRLKPGMRDGVPVAMWKQVPVTFRLQSTGSARF